MRRTILALLTTSLFALAALPAFAQSARPRGAKAPPGRADDAEVKALAADIDRLIEARWKDAKVTPAAPATDAEFQRRTYLDLLGRIPSITEVRDFLDDPAPDKRFRLVSALMAQERYPTHMAAVWRAVMMSQANDQLRAFAPAFEVWLRQRVKDGTPYDQVVRALMTGNPREQGAQVFTAFAGQRPEELASATARVFLGIKIECAQCHNHPFDKWTRDQFWEYAAFFSPDGQEIAVTGTGKRVKARFPDGIVPKAAGRAALAEWMTSGDNRFFARNAVNRLWEYFYGAGLIDPVDEPRADNPPSHPELLERLTKEFVAHKFDVNFLVRALTAARAYGLSSQQTDKSQADRRLFARMSVRGLSAEQLYDSILEVVGPDGIPSAPAPGTFNPGRRAEFLTRFPPQEKRTEVQTSILQALYLMNGQFMEEVTDPQRNRTLGTIIESRGSSARRIDELYMVTLSRKPTAEERARLVKYVDAGGPSRDAKKAYADVFWALLNSSEFFLNH